MNCKLKLERKCYLFIIVSSLFLNWSLWTELMYKHESPCILNNTFSTNPILITPITPQISHLSNTPNDTPNIESTANHDHINYQIIDENQV